MSSSVLLLNLCRNCRLDFSVLMSSRNCTLAGHGGSDGLYGCVSSLDYGVKDIAAAKPRKEASLPEQETADKNKIMEKANKDLLQQIEVKDNTIKELSKGWDNVLNTASQVATDLQYLVNKNPSLDVLLQIEISIRHLFMSSIFPSTSTR